MATSPEFAEDVLHRLAVAGEVRSRKMFGGVGIYLDEVFCAILTASDRFFMRAGPGNQADFEAEGMGPFTMRDGKSMSYYEVPERVLEDPEALTLWILKARDEALRAKKS